MSLPTIDDWVRRGCPYIQKPERRGGSGWRIDAGAVLVWHREQERQNALGDVVKIDEGEARRRKLAAEASLAEHELALKQGTAVQIEDAVKVWGDQVSAARARLLGIGHKLAPLTAVETDPLTCQVLIDGAVHEALAELSQFDPGEIRNTSTRMEHSPHGSPEDGRSMGTAAKAYRKRVGRQKPKAKPRSQRRARPVADQPS